MGDKKNIYIIVGGLIKEVMGKTKESFFALTLNKKIRKDGFLFSIMNNILTRGPQNFRENPTGITLGRAIFSPLAFLLSHRNSHESDDKK